LLQSEWMFEINNSTAIAQAVTKVVNNPQIPEYLLRWQQWVEEHFSLGNYIRKILKLAKIGSLSSILSTNS
jgi:glycosyltransferase involved in cell wall biosynthesis